jgi:hypothetical protein
MVNNKSYLHGRSQRVAIGPVKSNSMELKYGLPMVRITRNQFNYTEEVIVKITRNRNNGQNNKESIQLYRRI